MMVGVRKRCTCSERFSLSLKNETDAEQLLILERIGMERSGDNGRRSNGAANVSRSLCDGSVASRRTDFSGNVDDPLHGSETFNTALSRDWRRYCVRSCDEPFRRRQKVDRRTRWRDCKNDRRRGHGCVSIGCRTDYVRCSRCSKCLPRRRMAACL